MAQNSQPLDLQEALTRLYQGIPATREEEIVALSQARGRVLSKTAFAPINLPPFPASAMDGYALNKEDFARAPDAQFQVIGESLAGHPFSGTISNGQCVRIFTGAKVPGGADQVLLQEQAVTEGSRVSFAHPAPSESYVRPIGHDIQQGASLADVHDHLNGLSLGALAAAGVDQVSVFKLPRVGVFSSGDELVDPGTPVEELVEGQIFDSNRFAVLNLLANTPCELVDLGRLPDDPSAVETAIREASEHCEILITSGGVSVGDADFITATIAALGQLEFWRLNLKPGKPLAFGRVGDCYIFGLPGNPVSTIVTLLLLAKPAIWHRAGCQPPPVLSVPATLANKVAHTPGRAEYQRGQYVQTPDGLSVSSTGDQSSNRLQTFRGANCLIEIPGHAGDMPPGSLVSVLPFEGLLG